MFIFFLLNESFCKFLQSQYVWNVWKQAYFGTVIEEILEMSNSKIPALSLSDSISFVHLVSDG